jgi:hypothetical protein
MSALLSFAFHCYLYLYFNQYLYLNHTHTSIRKPYKKKHTSSDFARCRVSGKYQFEGGLCLKALKSVYLSHNFRGSALSGAE